MLEITHNPQRNLLFEITIILVIKIIFLYIIWSIVFAQRNPEWRTTQAMTNHLISQENYHVTR